jgi:glycogen operon protein
MEPDIVWHGVEPGRPDFSRSSRAIAFSLDGALTGREPDCDFYVACNAWRERLEFRVPLSPSGRLWRRVIDTGLAPPLDIVAEEEGPPVPANLAYSLAPFGLAVLITEA